MANRFLYTASGAKPHIGLSKFYAFGAIMIGVVALISGGFFLYQGVVHTDLNDPIDTDLQYRTPPFNIITREIFNDSVHPVSDNYRLYIISNITAGTDHVNITKDVFINATLHPGLDAINPAEWTHDYGPVTTTVNHSIGIILNELIIFPKDIYVDDLLTDSDLLPHLLMQNAFGYDIREYLRNFSDSMDFDIVKDNETVTLTNVTKCSGEYDYFWDFFAENSSDWGLIANMTEYASIGLGEDHITDHILLDFNVGAILYNNVSIIDTLHNEMHVNVTVLRPLSDVSCYTTTTTETETESETTTSSTTETTDETQTEPETSDWVWVGVGLLGGGGGLVVLLYFLMKRRGF